LAAGGNVTGAIALGSLAVPGGQSSTVPLATTSTVMTLTSAVAGLAADVVEGRVANTASISGTSSVVAGDTLQKSVQTVLPGAKGAAAAVVIGKAVELAVGATLDGFLGEDIEFEKKLKGQAL